MDSIYLILMQCATLKKLLLWVGSQGLLALYFFIFSDFMKFYDFLVISVMTTALEIIIFYYLSSCKTPNILEVNSTWNRGHSRWLSGKEFTSQCRRHRGFGFDPWVGMIPWRRQWWPSPVFLPRESCGQRSLVGYSLEGCKELDIPEQLSTKHKVKFMKVTDIINVA